MKAFIADMNARFNGLPWSRANACTYRRVLFAAACKWNNHHTNFFMNTQRNFTASGSSPLKNALPTGTSKFEPGESIGFASDARAFLRSPPPAPKECRQDGSTSTGAAVGTAFAVKISLCGFIKKN